MLGHLSLGIVVACLFVGATGVAGKGAEMKSENNGRVDFFLLSDDPLIYNVLRTCKIIREVHDRSGRIGWLIAIDPSIPLLRFLADGSTKTEGETTRLAIFGGDPRHVPVLSAQAPTRVDVYAVTSNGILNDGALVESNSVLYPPSLIHDSSTAALKYLSPMDEQRIRDWVAQRGPK